MVKIMIMDNKTLFKKVIDDVENRIEQKEDRIIVVDSIDAFRKLFTNERLRLLTVVKKTKPDSIYQLAKTLQRDLKSVQSDAKFLQSLGLLELNEYKEGLRIKLRPVVKAKNIQLEMAL